MGMQTSVSRRGFVAGAAVGAAGLGIAPNITPAYAQDEPAGQSDTAQVLNEQDYSYTTNSITDFTKTQLFSDWKLGPIELHHRMVKSAAFQLAFFNANPDEYFAYYERMAKGGVEMIWIEDFANFWDMTASPLKQDYDAYDVKGLVAALHADGAYVGYQFDTMGAPIGPLDYTEPFIGNYSTEEIQSWQQVVVDLAKRLQADGFDAIELNMAANNMGQSFLSRTRNNRDDEYGPRAWRTALVGLSRPSMPSRRHADPTSWCRHSSTPLRATTRTWATTASSLQSRSPRPSPRSWKKPAPTRCMYASGLPSRTSPSSPATCTSAQTAWKA